MSATESEVLERVKAAASSFRVNYFPLLLTGVRVEFMDAHERGPAFVRKRIRQFKRRFKKHASVTWFGDGLKRPIYVRFSQRGDWGPGPTQTMELRFDYEKTP